MSISGLSRLSGAPLVVGEKSSGDRAREDLAEQVYSRQAGRLSDPISRVEAYEAHMQRVTTVHISANEVMDWKEFSVISDPGEPSPERSRTNRAQQEFDAYSPSLMDFLIFRTGRIRNQLEEAISRAKATDFKTDEANRQKWQRELERAGRIRALAKAVLSGDERAWKHVIEHIDPLGSLIGIAQSATVRWDTIAHADVAIRLTTDDVVPETVLSLTKRQLLSEKPMAQKKRWETYEDVICGAAIRAAREIFHALPFRSVAVHCTTAGINRETGHDEDITVLSVHYPREEFLGLGFERIDPSDSLRRFRHNKDFKRGEGFRPVPRVTIADDIVAR